MKTRMWLTSGLDRTKIRTLLLAALLAVSVPLALSGCNTTEGVGEDIQDAGQGIEDLAN